MKNKSKKSNSHLDGEKNNTNLGIYYKATRRKANRVASKQRALNARIKKHK